jgi:class 3 adenylate cyclase
MKCSLLNILVFFLICFFNCSDKNTNQFKVKKGFFDLTEINLDNSLVKIDGDWKFYWKESKNEMYLKVPSSWNDLVVEGNKIGAYGYGTYEVDILLAEKYIGKILTLKIPHMGTAYELYLNNELISSNGKFAKSKEEMIPQYLSKIKNFLVKDTKVNIKILVSNFNHRKGGMRFNSLYIGSDQEVQKIESFNHLYIFFLMGSLLIMAFYHFGLYFLRREDIASLIFGLFCLCIFTRLCFIGDVWITSIYPELSWSWMYKLEYISLYLSALSFVYFTYFVFKNEFNILALKILTPIYSIFCLLILFTEPRVFTLSLNIFQAISFLNSLYILYVIIKAIRNRKEGSIAAIIGFSFFILAIINDLLYNNELWSLGVGNLIPFGVFLFIFSQSFILSQIFSKTFKSFISLSNNLKLTNEAYSRFVPVEFLKFLNKSSIVDIKLGDQMQKEMTILFSDIRSFTDLSEKLTPKENFNFLNSYLKRMSPIIQKNTGFIDKYIGDAIMALFPNRVEDAIYTAIEMHKELRLYNQHRLKLGYDPIKIGCGIHIGNLMLGIIGANERMEGTVIADSVNLAARIESLTKVYDSTILITETILNRITSIQNLNYRYIDQVKVKGKSELTTIYEIYDGQPDFMIDLKNQTKDVFEKGIRSYYDKKFEESIPYFQKVLEVNPNDQATIIYLKRANYYKENGYLEE